LLLLLLLLWKTCKHYATAPAWPSRAWLLSWSRPPMSTRRHVGRTDTRFWCTSRDSVSTNHVALYSLVIRQCHVSPSLLVTSRDSAHLHQNVI